MNPKFPDREVPLGKRSRPGPVFARARRTRRRRQLKERERNRERETEKKKTKKKRNDAPTIGTPRSLLSERITKDFSDDDDVDSDDRDDEVLLLRCSPVGRPRS